MTSTTQRTTALAASALFTGSATAATVIDYSFDGNAGNDVGPAVQVVENGVDDSVAGSVDLNTGLISTGRRNASGNGVHTHAIGINSSGTVDLSSFSGFTATFVLDSIVLSDFDVEDLLANGMFFGVVSGTNATGTEGRGHGFNDLRGFPFHTIFLPKCSS